MDLSVLSGITIEYIMGIVVILIIVISSIIGYVQGPRKSFCFFISSIIFWVLFFLLAPIVTNRKVWDNGVMLGFIRIFIKADGSNVPEVVANYIISVTSLEISSNLSGVYTLTASIIQCVLKILFLIIFAILYRYLFLFVYNRIFGKLTITSKKKLREYSKSLKKKSASGLSLDDKVSVKEQSMMNAIEKNRGRLKHKRCVGIVTGLCRGFLACFISLSIINSFVFSLPDVGIKDTIQAESEVDEDTTIYNYISEKYPALEVVINKILDYKQSNLAGVTGFKINGKSADKLFVDSIISGESDNGVFEFRDEFEQVCKIVDSACQMTDGFNMDSIDFYSLTDEQIGDLEGLLAVLADNSLVTSLLPTVISFASTMESLQEILPDDFDCSQFGEYDWSEEIRNIAFLVEYVYVLGDDLSTLDYTNLDPDKIEKIIEQLNKLQSVETFCKIGSLVAIDKLFSSEDEEFILEVKSKLAEVLWNDDIESISVLYREFIELEIKDKLDSSKNDDGSYNYLRALTSIPTDKFMALIDTLLETSFAEKILPDVLTLLKDKYIPSEYSDMINPNVVYTSDWKEEITEVLSIVKELSSNGDDPFVEIKEFSFSKLSSISTSTILSSKILSYAVINIIVSASDGTGIAGSVLGKYIKVPDELKVYNDNEKTYPDAWYGEDGELSIILTQIKNVAESIKDINYIGTSIVPVLSAINPDDLMSSQVLYYTVSSLITSYADEFIVVPETALSTEDKLDNGNSLILKDEIVAILDAFTDTNVFDISQVIKYYKLDENGNKIYTEYEDLEGNDYNTEFSLTDISSLMGILTSKKLYDVDNPDEGNLDKLFRSVILRATISCKLLEFTGDFIAIPDSQNATIVDYVCDENNIRTAINILTVKECKNLIKIVDKLNIDLETIMDNPLTIIDSFGYTDENELRHFNESLTMSIFTDGNDYSELLHATISKYLIDYSGKELVSGFSIIVPSSVICGNYISSEEIVRLFSDLYYIDICSVLQGNSSNDGDSKNITVTDNSTFMGLESSNSNDGESKNIKSELYEKYLDDLFVSKILKASILGVLY